MRLRVEPSSAEGYSADSSTSMCCPLRGERVSVQFASLTTFHSETKSEDVTYEEYAHPSYNSLSHDCCDKRFLVRWQARQSLPVLESTRFFTSIFSCRLSSLSKWRHCRVPHSARNMQLRWWPSLSVERCLPLAKAARRATGDIAPSCTRCGAQCSQTGTSSLYRFQDLRLLQGRTPPALSFQCL